MIVFSVWKPLNLTKKDTSTFHFSIRRTGNKTDRIIQFSTWNPFQFSRLWSSEKAAIWESLQNSPGHREMLPSAGSECLLLAIEVSCPEYYHFQIIIKIISAFQSSILFRFLSAETLFMIQYHTEKLNEKNNQNQLVKLVILITYNCTISTEYSQKVYGIFTLSLSMPGSLYTVHFCASSLYKIL